MVTITPHTTRATGTILTAAIYNGDHQNHITNANSLASALPGFSTFGIDLVDSATASDALTTLGVSTFAKTLLDDTDALAMRNTIGVEWETVYDSTFSAVTSVPVTNLSAYRNLRIIVNAQTDATPNVMFFQMSSNNGSSYITGATDYGNYMVYHDENTAGTVSGASSVTSGITTYRAIQSGNPLGLNWELTITNFNKSGTHKMWGGHMVNYNGSLVLHGNPTGRSNTAALLVAMDAIRLTCATAMSGYMLIEGQRG